MTPEPSAPFNLIRMDGEAIVFDDMLSLKRYLRTSRISVGDYHVACYTIFGHDQKSQIIRNEWIVRDLYGRRVTQAQINAVDDPDAPHRSGRWRRTWGFQDKQKLHAARLGLPIPGTAKRGSYGCLLRHPRHMNLYRARAALAYQPKEEQARGKIHKPPNAWDDILRSDYGRKSWKSHRKTQYRGKVV